MSKIMKGGAVENKVRRWTCQWWRLEGWQITGPEFIESKFDFVRAEDYDKLEENLKRCIDSKDFTIIVAEEFSRRLEEAEQIIQEAAATANYFDKCWDISDVSNIKIKAHGKETRPNDSLAGGSILKAFYLGKRIREYFEKYGDNK